MNEELNNNEIRELDFEELESVSGGKRAGQKIKATGDVNVRKGAGLAYDSLGVIYKGDTLEFLGQIKADDRGVYWGKVRYKGQSGWVSSKYAKII